MKSFRTKLSATAKVIGLVTIGTLLLLLSLHDQTDEDKSDPDSGVSKRFLSEHDLKTSRRFTNLSQRSASEVLDFLETIGDDKNALFEVAPTIAGSSHANDRRVLAFFTRADFSPEQFAQIVGLWERRSLGEAVLLQSLVRIAVSKDDLGWSLALGSSLADDEQRGSFWKQIAEATDFFKPINLQSSLELLPPQDKAKIVEGIVDLLTSSSYEDKKRLVAEYYKVTSDVEVLGPLIKPLISEWGKEDPVEAVEWLLTSTPQIARFGDRYLIGSLGRESIDLADSFVNQLCSSGQTKRASTVVSAMSDVFFRRDPKGAIEWINQLPTFIDGQEFLLTQKFTELSVQDWGSAQEVVDRLNSDRITKAFKMVEENRNQK